MKAEQTKKAGAKRFVAFITGIGVTAVVTGIAFGIAYVIPYFTAPQYFKEYLIMVFILLTLKDCVNSAMNEVEDME